MCRFFETIRITDGQPKFLSWHESRMNLTRIKFWNNSSVLSLKELIRPPAGNSLGISRCKVIYGKEIESLEFFSYYRKTITSLMLVICDDIDYWHKYLDRTRLDDLMAMKENCDDIIIVKNGFVTDSAMANLIFFDGKEWFTPDKPLLHGTCRTRLMQKTLVKERRIRTEDVDSFLGVKLINAMRYPDESEMIPVAQIQKKSTFDKKIR